MIFPLKLYNSQRYFLNRNEKALTTHSIFVVKNVVSRRQAAPFPFCPVVYTQKACACSAARFFYAQHLTQASLRRLLRIKKADAFASAFCALKWAL